jgi:hypothetical protein
MQRKMLCHAAFFYYLPPMSKPGLPQNGKKRAQFHHGRSFIAGLIITCLFLPIFTIAQGNLLIMPRRVVFEGTKKYEELNLANIGKDTSRYVISLIHYRMKENGEFEEIDKSDTGQYFADKWLRFFPHSVTLGPGESQLVKIQVTRSKEMAVGEYRSHIYFRAIPDVMPLGEKEPVRDSSSITVSLVPIFGISIPVIIRVGESSTKTTLTDLSLDLQRDTVPLLNLTIQRTGNMSVYGDLFIDYLPAQGKPVRVGDVRGIAVYTPNPIRRFQLDLNKARGVNYHSGKLHIVYTTPADSKLATLAEADLFLQ